VSEREGEKGLVIGDSPAVYSPLTRSTRSTLACIELAEMLRAGLSLSPLTLPPSRLAPELHRDHPAIHYQFGAGNKTTVVRGKENDSLSYFIGFTHSSQWDLSG
jgi:hypothetical protein